MTDLDMRNGDWILVGDGEKAMLFRNAGDDEFPNLEVIDLLENEKAGHLEPADRPGRFNDGTGPHRSAVQESDWQRLEKEEFAKTIAESLYRKAHRNQFDRLHIVAPPKTLGDLRSALHKEVAYRVVGEVSKTLTNHPVYEIEKVLNGRH